MHVWEASLLNQTTGLFSALLFPKEPTQSSKLQSVNLIKGPF